VNAENIAKPDDTSGRISSWISDQNKCEDQEVYYSAEISDDSEEDELNFDLYELQVPRKSFCQSCRTIPSKFLDFFQILEAVKHCIERIYR
jgi:hypothetical protein